MDASHDVNWYTFASDADRKRMDEAEKTLFPKPRTHIAPMVTLTRTVNGVPGETLRARWEPGVTIGNAAFFALRPGDEGKQVGFTVTVPSEAVPRSGGYSIGMEGLEAREVPMWSTDKSDLPGYARALAALQKRGVR